MAPLHMLVVLSQAIFSLLIDELEATVAATRLQAAVALHVGLAGHGTIYMNRGVIFRFLSLN